MWSRRSVSTPRKAAREARNRGEASDGSPLRLNPGLKDSMGDRSNHSNLSVIRIRSNFCQNSCEFARIHEKFRHFKTVHHFSQKIFSLGLYELFRWVYVRCERRDCVARQQYQPTLRSSPGDGLVRISGEKISVQKVSGEQLVAGFSLPLSKSIIGQFYKKE